jgi:hypothetical protein
VTMNSTSMSCSSAGLLQAMVFAVTMNSQVMSSITCPITRLTCLGRLLLAACRRWCLP